MSYSRFFSTIFFWVTLYKRLLLHTFQRILKLLLILQILIFEKSWCKVFSKLCVPDFCKHLEESWGLPIVEWDNSMLPIVEWDNSMEWFTEILNYIRMSKIWLFRSYVKEKYSFRSGKATFLVSLEWKITIYKSLHYTKERFHLFHYVFWIPVN